MNLKKNYPYFYGNMIVYLSKANLFYVHSKNILEPIDDIASISEVNEDNLINRLVEDDVESIKSSLEDNNTDFLERALKGTNWIPYTMLSKEKLFDEYTERFYLEE